MKEKLYLDSNVFVYASTSIEKEGNAARLILKKIKNGEVEGATSILTVDEILWALQKMIGKESAHSITTEILVFPNLTLVDATKGIVADALKLYLQEKADPRDAIHLATMNFKSINKIVTEDEHFEKFNNIKRVRLS